MLTLLRSTPKHTPQVVAYLTPKYTLVPTKRNQGLLLFSTKPAEKALPGQKSVCAAADAERAQQLLWDTAAAGVSVSNLIGGAGHRVRGCVGG